MERLNDSVPKGEVIKHLQNELDKVQPLIDSLKAELDLKNKMIDAFKNWQKRYVEFGTTQWIQMAIKELGLTKSEAKDLRWIRKQLGTPEVEKELKTLRETNRRLHKENKELVGRIYILENKLNAE